jgi:hypothetical protein
MHVNCSKTKNLTFARITRRPYRSDMTDGPATLLEFSIFNFISSKSNRSWQTTNSNLPDIFPPLPRQSSKEPCSDNFSI